MKHVLLLSIAFVATNSFAETIYEKDSSGNDRRNRPSYQLTKDEKGNTVIKELDTTGNVRRNKPGFKEVDGILYETDSTGNIRRNRPSYKLR